MKKFIATEVFWFVIALLTAFPLGLVVLNLLGDTSFAALRTQREREMIVVLYLISVGVAFVGVYIARFVALAIKVMVVPEEKDEEKEAAA